MKIVRSWPYDQPAHRAFVEDNLPVHYMKNFEYRLLFEEMDDSFILLEWDIAVSKEDLARFVLIAQIRSDRVLVAPYSIYNDDGSSHLCQFNYDSTTGERYSVSSDSVHCQASGFGMIYIPDYIRQAVLRDIQGTINDGIFSDYMRNVQCEPFRIIRSVHPIHLHYDALETFNAASS